MALILSEEFTFRNNQDAFEKASYYFGRLKRLASTALLVVSNRSGEFQDSSYREDCVYYQLEAIRDLADQFDDLFDKVAVGLGRKSDLQLKALDEAPTAEAALLARYRSASKEDQDFILVHSYFMARKGWSETMRGYLSELARLCVDEAPGLAEPVAELLPEDSGEGVLAGNMNQAQPSASIVNVVE